MRLLGWGIARGVSQEYHRTLGIMRSLSLALPFPLTKTLKTHSNQAPSQSSNPISIPNSPSEFLKISNDEYPLARKRRIQAKKSARSESDATQNPPSFQSVGSTANSFLSLLCPLLKFFGVRSSTGGDPSQERNEILEVATSSLSSLARFPWGSRSLKGITHNLDSTTSSPQLQLYEFEACPFCRRVREALTELDLTVEVYPCPKGSVRHREMVRKIGGKEQFPFLVDLDTGISLYESGDIVKYLFQQYGQGRNPSFGLLESTIFTGWVPTLLRAGRGMTAWQHAKSEAPPKRLELFSYENNAHARIVREALCELELPYILHNVGEGSSKYDLFRTASSYGKVPYLIDPNTGVEMGDYKKVLHYLFQTYSDRSLSST